MTQRQTAEDYMSAFTKLAVIGDVHGFWDAADTAFFNQSDYDGLLFTGDLPRLTGGLDVARALARLEKPAWLVPGNHDGCTALQLLAELKGWSRLCRLLSTGMEGRVRRLAAALGPVRLAGYECLPLGDDLGLLVGRPHAMGPDRFYFRDYTRRRYGIGDYAQSAARLKALVDSAPPRLIVLGHNGPAGLGETAADIWGCDFSTRFGDFGDPDLRAAIDHARDSGRQVLAVCAGHMHRRSKTGAERQPAVREDGSLYLNAASVSRQRHRGEHGHHVALTLQAEGAAAEDIWIDRDGQILSRTALA